MRPSLRSLHGIDHDRRSAGWIAGLLAAAALLAGAPAAPAQTDDRPVQWLMLQALESGFVAFGDDVAAAYRDDAQRLAGAFRREAAALDAERGAMAERWREARDALDARRDALNQRIDAVNAEVHELEGRLAERREMVAAHDRTAAGGAGIAEAERAIERQHQRLRELQGRYRDLADAAGRAYRDMENTRDTLRDGGHPAFSAIARLREEFARFATSEHAALQARIASYEREKDDFRDWIADRNAQLKEEHQLLEAEHGRYDETKSRHDALAARLAGEIEQFNRRVEEFNAGTLQGADREAEQASIESLDGAIDALRTELERARERALAFAARLEAGTTRFRVLGHRIQGEKEVREAAIVAEGQRLRAESRAVIERIGERRAEVQGEVAAREAAATAELDALRARVVADERAIEKDFGKDAGALLAALRDWLAGGDDSVLFDDGAAPRYATDAPGTAAIYEAVGNIREQRATIERAVGALGALGRRLEAADEELRDAYRRLQERREAIGAEREALRAERAALDDAVRESRDGLRRRAADQLERQRTLAADLERLYDTQAALNGLDFEAVQGALVAAMRDTQPEPPKTDERTALVHTRERLSATMPADLRPRAPDFTAFVGRLEARATAGSAPAWQPPGAWTAAAQRESAGARTLTGAERRALAAAWLAGAASNGGPGGMREAFAAAAPWLGAATAERLERALFLLGAADVAGIEEHRFEDGGVGYRLRVLDHDYWIDGSGHLERG